MFFGCSFTLPIRAVIMSSVWVPSAIRWLGSIELGQEQKYSRGDWRAWDQKVWVYLLLYSFLSTHTHTHTNSFKASLEGVWTTLKLNSVSKWASHKGQLYTVVHAARKVCSPTQLTEQVVHQCDPKFSGPAPLSTSSVCPSAKTKWMTFVLFPVENSILQDKFCHYNLYWKHF